MLAKGPPCTNAGVFSRVCTRLGWNASLSSTVIAPGAFNCEASIGSFARLYPMTILPIRLRRSTSEVDRQKIAMISEATTISNPSERGKPFGGPPRAMVISRSARSFMSMTRFQTTRRVSMSRALPWWMWLSMRAESRLCANAMALKSPVKCKLMSSIGTICAYPPPAAPPFIPKTGPKDGSRRQIIARLPIALKPSPRPTLVVVLPSPAGVGLIAVTKINLAFGLTGSESR